MAMSGLPMGMNMNTNQNCRPSEGIYPVRTAANPNNPNLQLSYADMNCDGHFNTNDSVILSNQVDAQGVTDVDAHLTSRRLRQMANRRNPDLNGDFRVTAGERRESLASERAVNRMDRNSDGRVSGSELRRRARGRFTGLPKAFTREQFSLGFDSNNDGRFSRAERDRSTVITSVSANSVQVRQRSPFPNPFGSRPMTD